MAGTHCAGNWWSLGTVLGAGVRKPLVPREVKEGFTEERGLDDS